jgi:transcriptional regulator with PAS, ATPase and Fis domain
LQQKETQKAPAANPMAGIVGKCVQMKSIYDTVQKVAWSPTASVLILGESGTGKELIARAIHESGPFADQPFIEINCSALPDNLIETELFGYDAGAFTDAKKTKKGLLELADGGTFFMDEIGDLNLNLQVKLVKALEEKVFRRVGGTKNIRVTMRIMAATNRDLAELIRQGRFREDLFYRLNVVAIHAPPLRERSDDIVLLGQYFLTTACKEHNRKVRGFTAKAKQQLLSYPWPGNVRELKNAVERAVLLGSDSRIDSADLQLGAGHIVDDFPTQVHQNGRIQIEIPPQGIYLEELEREAIKKAMRMANGNLSKAARLLHVTRETLRYRIKKFKVA